MPRKYTPLIRHAQTVKINRLFDMLYKPAEIADEVGITVDTLKRSWIAYGLPVRKDGSGHIWINGKDCKSWMKKLIEAKKKPVRPKTPEDQIYCFKCRVTVPFVNPTLKTETKNMRMMQATCPVCGKVNFRTFGKKAIPGKEG